MAKKLNIITLGSDPELMLLNDTTGEIVNAIPVLNGNKHKPIDLSDGIKLYSDNVLAEMQIPPAFTVEGAVEQLQRAFQRAKNHLKDTYQLLPLAAHRFSGLGEKPSDELVLKWLNDLVPSDAVPEAWQVGCSPNWCAYSPNEPRRQSPFKDNLRTGSFHIHIGNVRYEEPGEVFLKRRDSKIEAVKLMDAIVGCASIILDKDATSPLRKALYGKAGEFRPTPYGIEYRVLGNYFLRTPQLAGLMFDLTAYAMGLIWRGEHKQLLAELDFATVQSAINDNDKNKASSIINQLKLPMPLISRIQVESVYNPGYFNKAWELS